MNPLPLYTIDVNPSLTPLTPTILPPSTFLPFLDNKFYTFSFSHTTVYIGHVYNVMILYILLQPVG